MQLGRPIQMARRTARPKPRSQSGGVEADPGRTFEQISETDPSTAHWFPNLQRPLGHAGVGARPGLIYQAGPAGDGLSDLLTNEVYYVE